MEKKIAELKRNFNANSAEVLRTERDLNKVVDDDAREEVLKMQRFKHLNNEKITTNFLSLAKKPNKSDCLTDVCDDNGVPFEYPGEQDSYMRNYYASMYRHLPDTVNDQSINNFLGNTINHPVVESSRLNEDERENLERDLSIVEFDKAIERAKLNTAPGIDGISNRFIKKFCISSGNHCMIMQLAVLTKGY